MVVCSASEEVKKMVRLVPGENVFPAERDGMMSCRDSCDTMNFSTGLAYDFTH